MNLHIVVLEFDTKLQDNPNLIIRYANDDPHQLEGLQQTTKKTIKKWLEYNSN